MLDYELCSDIVYYIADQSLPFGLDAVVAIESRGFLFGAQIAQRLKIPFIPIRKEGKLPADTVSQSYDLEYGTSVIEMHKEDLPKGSKVMIHDDLLATAGTACAAAELVNAVGSRVNAFSFLTSLDALQGEQKLEQYAENIISLVHY